MTGFRMGLYAALMCSLGTELAGTQRSQSEPSVHLGAGPTSCGKWLEARKQERTSQPNPHSLQAESLATRHFMALSWIQGYLVGVALGTNGAYDERTAALKRIPDDFSIDLWMDKYCRENPSNKVLDGAARLQFEISRQP